MNAATLAWIRCYRAEWAKCAAALLRHGYSDDELEAQRHRIHIEALGRDCSSKDIKTLRDRDEILKFFRAYSRPTDLAEQLRLIDQPEQRLAAFRDRARRLALDLGIESHGVEAYLETISQRRYQRAWSDTRETEAAGICGILTARLKARRTGQPHAHT